MDSPLQILLGIVSDYWGGKKAPDPALVASELSSELSERAEALSALNVRQLALLFDRAWPEYFLCSLSARHQLYYFGAYYLLFFDGLARKSGGVHYLTEITSDADYLINIPGHELASIFISKKIPELIALASPIDLHLMHLASTLIDTHVDLVALNPSQQAKLARSAQMMWRSMH